MCFRSVPRFRKLVLATVLFLATLEMEEQIQMLITVSGKPYGVCRQVLIDMGCDVDTAAVILLGDSGENDIRNYEDIDPKKNNKYRRIGGVEGEDQEDVEELGEEDDDDEEEEVSIVKEISRQQQQQQQQQSSNARAHDFEIDISKPEKEESEQSILLIPYHRLQDLLERITIPSTIQLKQIWTVENVIPIPGGITICEVTASTDTELETFLSILATQLLRYKMSTCFNIESITKRANRVDYLKKMETFYSDLLEVESKRVIKKFQDEVIFHSSIVYDDTAVNTTSQMSHVLTVTLSGLPELLLVMQDASQAIASSMSSSSSNGNSLSCIPNEWSLLCHTLPYALILLQENSTEWNTVLENGRWSEKTSKSVVKCIHRIENIELWRCYCSKREGIERLRGDANEKWYWHGTKTLSPEVIAREGFDFRVANPGSYGRGAYFAHSVNYSSNGYQHLIPGSYQVTQPSSYSNYRNSKKRKGGRNSTPAWSSPPAFIPPTPGFGFHSPAVAPGTFGTYGGTETTTVTDSVMQLPPGVGPGDSQLILARVCLGNTSVSGGNMGLTRPPVGFDSVTGGATMSIVYDLAMAYPSYIITYR